MTLNVDQLPTNVIYCGDCKDVLKRIPNDSIDLIYLDPPFFSQKIYENFWIKDQTSTLGFSDADWERLRGSIDPAIMKEYDAMEERWKGGRSKGIYVYIAYMRERLEQCYRVLKPIGSIYLHCDQHAGHYLKVMMDEIFGYENFRNEIIWKRKTGRGETQHKSYQFGICVDNILFYSKSKNVKFNTPFIPLTEADSIYTDYVETNFKFIDDNGRKYRSADLSSPSPRPNLKYVYKGYAPPENGWAVSKEKMEEWDKEGRLLFPKNKDGRIRRKLFLDELKGKPVQNLWDDIQMISSQSNERLGYPTQKPESLLERIINTSSDEGDIVLDPFCGCGTAIAVAYKLKRRWIGIDLSRTACDVMAERMRRLGCAPKIIGGETKEDLKAMPPHEFARFIIVEKMGGIVNPKKSGDMGIDGWLEFMTVPVQVKHWEVKVGRPEIDAFLTAITRAKKRRGVMIASDFSSNCHAEVARINNEHMVEITLLPVGKIMGWE